MKNCCLLALFLSFGVSVVRADIYLVTNTDDFGPGSLRQAINDANAHPNSSESDPDRINFAIPGTGVQTIMPDTSLPGITDAVIIDGFTQPGAVPNSNPVGQGLNASLKIELDGIYVPFTSSSNGLTITGGNTTIQGLVISRFQNGIMCQGGSGNIIAGNYIGTDPAGTFAPVIPFPEDREYYGVVIQDCQNTRVGGQTPDARNLLAGAFGEDVLITGPAATANVVEGNLISTQASGMAALSALNDYGSGSGIWLAQGAHANLIGGTVIEARNVIAGVSRGIYCGVNFVFFDFLPDALPTYANMVKGNFIGLNVTGVGTTDSDLDPTGIGVTVTGHDNIIGGMEPGARNVISGNRSGGIAIGYHVATNNLIQGNFIGTDESGTLPLGNGRFGVEIQYSANNNIIGGTDPKAANRIAFTYPGGSGAGLGAGVGVHSGPPSVTGNAILGNSIFGNEGIGIDLNIDGVTPNDAGDADIGPNNYQNYPVLSSADFIGGTVKISGTLDSIANQNYRIEFFGDTIADASTFGEGRVFLGAVTTLTGVNGIGSFDVTLSYPAGTRIVSATATDPTGNTSEFSGALSIAGTPAAQLLNISTRGHVLTGDNVLIGGTVVGGVDAKKVIFRAIGPSLVNSGFQGALGDPTLTLYDQSGAVLASNDNWKDTQQNEIQASGFAPNNDLESAIVATLMPKHAYTAVVRGKGNVTGTALVEAYDIDHSSYAQVLNISTRGFVGTADDVLIGGLIIGGSSGSARIVVRAIGPSLATYGISNALIDPTLELRNQNGALIASNDDWKQTQAAEITATGLAPADDAESAIVTTLPPGPATAIVRGKNDTTGVGLVEIYSVH